MSGETILIVEDNYIELTVLQSDLESSGFKCITANNGNEALDKLNHESVDLIISDQNMPSMGGPGAVAGCQKPIWQSPFHYVDPGRKY